MLRSSLSEYIGQGFCQHRGAKFFGRRPVKDGLGSGFTGEPQDGYVRAGTLLGRTWHP
jgi:hypothetical protein